MSIFVRNRPPVKPYRHTPKPVTPFGQGILPTYPTHRLACTLADMEWAAQCFGEISDRRDSALDREYDRLAALSFTQDYLDRGYFAPADVTNDHPHDAFIGEVA